MPPLLTSELVNLLEQKRLSLTNQDVPLSQPDLQQLKNCCRLVNAKRESLATTNSRKRRAHTILSDICGHSHEIFLLCSLSVTPSNLAKLTANDYLEGIIGWWKGIPRHEGLNHLSKRYEKLLPGASSAILGPSAHDTIESSTFPVVTDTHSTVTAHANTLEKAMRSAAGYIPNLEKRRIWLSSCLDQLQNYRQLAQIERKDTDTFVEMAEAEYMPEKVATSTTMRISTDVSSTLQVGYFAWERLRAYVGVALLSDIEASEQRQHELRQGWAEGTFTTSLILAPQSGDDFVLSMPVSSNIAMQIRTAESLEDLRLLFGEYLFEAISSSQSKAAHSSAAAVTVTTQTNGDNVLILMLSFNAGCVLYAASQS